MTAEPNPDDWPYPNPSRAPIKAARPAAPEPPHLVLKYNTPSPITADAVDATITRWRQQRFTD